MKISVFGLGYVGAVCCATFAKNGNVVIGVDINQSKIDLINKGESTIVEDGLDELIHKAVNSKNLIATTDHFLAVQNSEVSFICVGTPSQLNGKIERSFVYKVVQQIAEVLKEKDTFHTIIIRSTVTPGTLGICGQIISDVTGKKLNEDFGLVSNPEFLREGTAIYDFDNPPYTVFGATCKKSEKVVLELYDFLDAPIYSIKPQEAEMIKYANNNFHALKISFANEIGNISKAMGIDANIVMDIVSQDTKLNLSPYYLKPGFAFGGSCLPKDVRGLDYLSKSLNISTPVISNLINSNEYQIKRGLELIVNTGKRKVGLLGLAFKAGTDDLRESPLVNLVEQLLDESFEVLIYDSNVHLSGLMGKNKDYITGHIPHIYRLLKPELEEVINNSEVIVIGNKAKEFENILSKIPSDKIIVDLVRIEDNKTSNGNYIGICW